MPLTRLDPFNQDTTGWFTDSATGKVGWYMKGVKVFEHTQAGVGLSVPAALAGSLDLSAVGVTLPKTAILYASGTIPAADITNVAAGKLGHANGQILLAGAGAGTVIEFISGIIGYHFGTAAFTGGGNVTFNYAGGGGAVSGLVSAANSIGAAGDKNPLLLAVAPTNNQGLVNTGINLAAASAFTQPGTAAGTINWAFSYRVHTP